jgi:hypothetical protein
MHVKLFENRIEYLPLSLYKVSRFDLEKKTTLIGRLSAGIFS